MQKRAWPPAAAMSVPNKDAIPPFHGQDIAEAGA